MTRPPVRSASPSFLHSDRILARAARPVVRFLHVEAAGGILLVAATIVALVWANSPWRDSYDSLWSTTIRLDIGSYRFEEDLAHVVNDLFMALFFFVVGMEIKRELVVGELRDRRAVGLPAMAAPRRPRRPYSRTASSCSGCRWSAARSPSPSCAAPSTKPSDRTSANRYLPRNAVAPSRTTGDDAAALLGALAR